MSAKIKVQPAELVRAASAQVRAELRVVLRADPSQQIVEFCCELVRYVIIGGKLPNGAPSNIARKAVFKSVNRALAHLYGNEESRQIDPSILSRRDSVCGVKRPGGE